MTSTETPNTSSSSHLIPDNVRREMGAENSMMRSTSLFSFSVPAALDPNKMILLIGYLFISLNYS